jgi:hypothetical protein
VNVFLVTGGRDGRVVVVNHLQTMKTFFTYFFGDKFAK